MSKSRVVLSLLLLVLAVVPVSSVVAKDRDGDRLPDRWERRHGLSTGKKSGRRDPDRDRLRNRREFRLRLHPRRRDTDRDGLGDGAEVRRWKTNPRRRDTDRDGLGDGAEVRRWKTNPRRADTDGDGVKDGVEVLAGTNALDRSSFPSSAPGPGPGAGSAPPPGGFPDQWSTGLPAGWQPAQTRSTNMTVSTPGAVVQDIRFTNGADLLVAAPNVTVRRVHFLGDGGQINNTAGGGCSNGLVVEDSQWETIDGTTDPTNLPAIQWGGYTARRLKIFNGRSEGLFVGAKSNGCGPVRIEDTFIKLKVVDICVHADGIQGYDGGAVTIRNVTADSSEVECGTSPFFYPHSQGNTSADIDRLMVIGGGYSFRLGMPGRVRNLKIIQEPGVWEDGWAYGPIDVRCSAVTEWDAQIVTVDGSPFHGTSTYEVESVLRQQPCNSSGGG